MTDTDRTSSPYSFEDIEPYTFVRYNGRPGWVLDKGNHLVPSIPHSSHIHIQFTDDPDRDHKNETKEMHENVVDQYIEQGRRLFIDFEDALMPEGQ
jgi:hypothetical protein